MLKGTSKRDNKWHKRHIAKRSKRAITHAYNLATYKRFNALDAMKDKSLRNRASQEAERRHTETLWFRIVAFIKSLFRKMSWQN